MWPSKAPRGCVHRNISRLHFFSSLGRVVERRVWMSAFVRLHRLPIYFGVAILSLICMHGIIVCMGYAVYHSLVPQAPESLIGLRQWVNYYCIEPGVLVEKYR